MTELKKPKVNSEGQKELDKVEKQFEAFDENVKNLTLERSNSAPKELQEPQTKIAQVDLDKKKDVYLKPSRSISSREKFNEKYREEYNFAKEYVNFIAEHKEIIGETIEMWTKPFAGMPAEEWKIPTNKPVWAPRYVAEQLRSKFYHRLKMDQSQMASADGMGTYYGAIAVDTIVQRLDAIPVSSKRSIFMGSR